MASITAAEARLYLPELTGTARDAVLDTLIVRAEDVLARYCGFYDEADPDADLTFRATSRTLYLDGTVKRYLTVPYGPIQSVTSVYDDVEREYNADDLVAATDYEIFNRDGPQLWLKLDSVHGLWQRGTRNIKLTATLGYTTVPSVIKGCIARLTAHYYRLASPRAGSQSLSGNGQSQTFRDETIPAPILHDLARFRRFDTGWG